MKLKLCTSLGTSINFISFLGGEVSSLGGCWGRIGGGGGGGGMNDE